MFEDDLDEGMRETRHLMKVYGYSYEEARVIVTGGLSHIFGSNVEYHMRWYKRFYEMAQLVASWSKDPSTKVGVVIARPDNTIASVGFNGFPRGVRDLPERYLDRAEKHPRVVHAELNAILNCRERPVGYTLFITPVPPCSSCAGAVIQSGIKHVVFLEKVDPNAGLSGWRDTIKYTEDMFKEASVEFVVCPVSLFGE